MPNKIEEILIHEKKLFEIDVKLDNSKYYSASINISKESAILEVFGEVYENERIISDKHFMGETIDYLEGVNSRYKFHFYELTVFHFTQRSIHGATNRSACHIKLHVNYFHLSIAHPSSNYSTNTYSSLQIYSPTITKWLGVTKKQLEIYKNTSNSRIPSKDHDLLVEFEVDIENKFNFNISYNAMWKKDFNSHITMSKFPPCLNINFRVNFPDFYQIKQIINDIISLFYTLTGQPMMIEKAYLSFPGFTGREPLYLSGSDYKGKGVENKDILLHYNSDNLFYKEQEVSFPIESFNTYFCLNKTKKDVYRKFLLYDNLTNKEEKFLGLFRVVEKLTYIESFYVDEALLNTKLENLKIELLNNGVKNSIAKKLIGRFLKVNSQKINAESAIFKFIRSLDKKIYQEIKHLEKDIQKIVKLRNDITHCRPHSLEENEIDKLTLVLNYLSILLLWREMGLSKHRSFKHLHNYLRYNELKNKEN